MKIIIFILTVIFSIPFYALFLYSMKYPEQAAKMGKRWVYNGDVEPSEDYIKYIKVSSIIGVVFITSVLIIVFIKY